MLINSVLEHRSISPLMGSMLHLLSSALCLTHIRTEASTCKFMIHRK